MGKVEFDIKNNKPKKRFFHNKKNIFLILSLLIISVSAAAVVLFINYDPSQDVEEILTNSLAKSLDGDYEAAQTTLDSAISETKNSDKKSQFYIQKSSIAIDSEKYDDACKFAEKSEELAPSVQSARLIAISSEGQKDYEKSIKYYEIAISRIVVTDEQGEIEIMSIRNAITRLKVGI